MLVIAKPSNNFKKTRWLAVAEYAWNYHKKLVRGAVKWKDVFISYTRERDTFICGKVSRGKSNTAYPQYIQVIVDPDAQKLHCSCMFYQPRGRIVL